MNPQDSGFGGVSSSYTNPESKTKAKHNTLLCQIETIDRLFNSNHISVHEALDMLETLQLLEASNSYGSQSASVLGAMITLETKLNDRLAQPRKI